MPNHQNLDDLIQQSRPGVVACLKKKLPRAKPEKQPPNSLIKLIFGAICVGAGAALGGDPLNLIQQILFSFGIELNASWYTNYLDAQRQNNAEREDALLEEAISKTEVRAALADLFEAYNLRAILRDELQLALEGWFEKIRLPLPTIDATEKEHLKFVDEVRAAFQWRNLEVEAHPPVDLLVVEPSVVGEPRRTLVKCIATQQGRAHENALASIWGVLEGAKRKGLAENGLLVTNHGLSLEAHRQATDAGWKVQRYEDLLAGMMNFSAYHRRLWSEFYDREDPKMPAIGEYYVDLLATHQPEDKNGFDLLDEVWRWIDGDEQKPLMLIGEYGTGKTTFTRRLAAKLAQDCLDYRERKNQALPAGPRPRLPIRINLLDFVGTQRIEALITHHLGNQCHVANSQFRLFDAMNAAGLFVIILDGFDEMAERVDPGKIELNLKQIERLLAPRAKVLLTGRREFFMKEKELRDAFTPSALPLLLRERFKDYRPLWLTLWDDPQITDFLQKLVPRLPEVQTDWAVYKNKIDALPGFADLSHRPVLLDMIAKTLPDFESGKMNLSRPNLYQLYLEKELRRQHIKEGRKLLVDDATRFALLQELARQSFELASGGIDFEAAQVLVKPKLPPHEQAADKVAQNTRDFLSSSFLRPLPNDVFVFSHRSFRGYLAAKELMPRLVDGTAAAQKIDQDCIGFLAEMLEEKCSSAFYRQQVETALKKDGIPDWIKKTKDGRYVSLLPSGLEVEMVYVPAGPFVLGAEGELQPQIAVLEKGFWMDKTPVTNEQYREFLKANPKHPAPNVKEDWAKPYNWNGRDFPKGAAKHPVVLVSWNDAQAFCKWSGKVLPAELQWEKSARGIDGRRWPWGSEWDREKCNSDEYWQGRKPASNNMKTTPVGQFQIESPYGCVDSAGNVWEWCEDYYDEQKSTRAVRGGAWDGDPQYVVCAIRSLFEPVDRSHIVGFRCART